MISSEVCGSLKKISKRLHASQQMIRKKFDEDIATIDRQAFKEEEEHIKSCNICKHVKSCNICKEDLAKKTKEPENELASKPEEDWEALFESPRYKKMISDFNEIFEDIQGQTLPDMEIQGIFKDFAKIVASNGLYPKHGRTVTSHDNSFKK